MAVRLDWPKPASADSIKVYRSLSKIDLANLPDPLVTLAGDATFYSDVTAARNTIYNYVVATALGDDVVFTQNQEYGYFPETGPGPSVLMRGNWREGYFGTVSQTDFIGAADLCTALNFAPNSVNTSAVTWHKFILDGKILFIPQLSIAMTNLYDLYRNGLVYGTDDNGARPTDTTGIGAQPGVNQLRKVIINNLEFKARLPKASSAPTTEYLKDLTAGDARWGEGEWNRTFGRMAYNAFTLCIRSRWGQLTSYGSNNVNFTAAFTQHMLSPTANITMFSASSDVPSSMAWNSSYYSWRPVLELVL